LNPRGASLVPDAQRDQITKRWPSLSDLLNLADKGAQAVPSDAIGESRRTRVGVVARDPFNSHVNGTALIVNRFGFPSVIPRWKRAPNHPNTGTPTPVGLEF
jgi:hypothetical protein